MIRTAYPAAVMVRASERAIDDLAARARLSRRGLAMAAGLDDSALNPSRTRPSALFRQGMSTQTVAALLRAASVTPLEWARIVEGHAAKLTAHPAISAAEKEARR